MSLAARITLAVVIFLVDVAVFFIPLGALVIVSVILVRPRWALEFMVKLYEGVDFGGANRAADGGAPGRRDEPPGTAN